MLTRAAQALVTAWDKGIDKAKARALLKDPEAPAAALLVAAKVLLGPEFLAWEPETVLLELVVSRANRDKLSAAVALATMPAFFWDARVLGNTALALNDEVVFPDRLPHVTPEQLAWAVLEAKVIFAVTDGGDTTPSFDDEAEAYAAAMLFDAGYAFCPDELDFADEHLVELLSKEGRELHAKVKDASAPSKAGPSGEDPALDVQLERRAGVEAYVRHRLETLRDSLR